MAPQSQIQISQMDMFRASCPSSEYTMTNHGGHPTKAEDALLQSASKSTEQADGCEEVTLIFPRLEFATGAMGVTCSGTCNPPVLKTGHNPFFFGKNTGCQGITHFFTKKTGCGWGRTRFFSPKKNGLWLGTDPFFSPKKNATDPFLGRKTFFSVKSKMMPKVLSCQRAQENMYVQRSQPIVRSCRPSKGGFWFKKGRHLKRLRPPATAFDP